jgi:chromate reductase, NAD(P)H dehydrogenase (quinone)
MTTTRKKILAISGSTRNNSSNETILRFIANTYNSQLEVQLYQGLAALPHFNPDLDNEMVPAVIRDFRDQISKADGVIICTPEYVFAPPGALKNALEWTVSTTVFSDKPFAMIVASGLGEKTFESLTLIMNTLGVKMHENSRLLIQGARSKVNAQGHLIDQQVAMEIAKLVSSLIGTMNH